MIEKQEPVAQMDLEELVVVSQSAELDGLAVHDEDRDFDDRQHQDHSGHYDHTDTYW